MTLLEVAQLASVIVSPAFAAGGAYAAVRVRLRHLEQGQRDLREDVRHAHERIDGMLARVRNG